MHCPASQDSGDKFTPEPVSRRMAVGVALVSITLLALGTYAVMKLYNTAEQAPYMFRPTARIIINDEFRERKGDQFIDSLEAALVRGLEGAAGLRVVAGDFGEESLKSDFLLRVGSGSTDSDVLFLFFESDSIDTLWSSPVDLHDTRNLINSIRMGEGPVNKLSEFLTTLER